MEFLGLLPELPTLFAVAFVCVGPFVAAILMGRLIPSGTATKLIAAADTAVTIAKADAATWRAAWNEERSRADSYQGAAAESVELGRAANHLLAQLPHLGEEVPTEGRNSGNR